MPHQRNVQKQKRAPLPPRLAALRHPKPSAQPPSIKYRRRARDTRPKGGLSRTAAIGIGSHRVIRSLYGKGKATHHNITFGNGSHKISILTGTELTKKALETPLVRGSRSKESLYTTGLTVTTLPSPLTISVPGNFFYDFMLGTYKRIKRSRMSICAEDYTAYDITNTQQFTSLANAKLAIETYYYECYQLARQRKVLVGHLPRNIAFLLKILAHDCWYIENGIRYDIDFTCTYTPLSDVDRGKVMTLLGNNYLAYSLTSVWPDDTKPFCSSFLTKGDGVIQPAHFYAAYSSKMFSSCFCFFQDPDNASPYYASLSNNKMNDLHWPVCATLARTLTPTAVLPFAITTLNSAISVPPNVLRQWVAFDDSMFDEQYIFSTTFDEQAETFPETTEPWVELTSMYSVPDAFTAMFNPDSLSHLNWAIYIARMVYAPFLAVGDFVDAAAAQTFGIVSCFRGPLYIPSVVHEAIVGNTSCVSLAVERDTASWRGKIFHYSNPGSYNITQANLDKYLEGMRKLFATRHFFKMNAVPESTPSKALIPSFFLKMEDTDKDTMLYYTPYSYQYVDSHNLGALATNIWWPKLNETSGIVLASLSLPVTEAISEDMPSKYMMELCFDFSFQSDSSEIDHYLHDVRINYLGGFGFLSGLLKTAKNATNSIMNSVIRPALRNPMVQSITHVAASALGGPGLSAMVDAGITMISSSPAGPPNNSHTLDLSTATKGV